jgi:hypothetical protein
MPLALATTLYIQTLSLICINDKTPSDMTPRPLLLQSVLHLGFLKNVVVCNKFVFCLEVLSAIEKMSCSCTLSDLSQYRGDNPLYPVLVPKIFGKQRHFLIYSVMLPNITGYPRNTNGFLAQCVAGRQWRATLVMTFEAILFWMFLALHHLTLPEEHWLTI